MPPSLRIKLGVILAIGLVAFAFSAVAIYDWVLAGRLSSEVFRAPKLVLVALVIAGFAGSIPLAFLSVKLARRRDRPPREIAGHVVANWLLANAACASATYFFTAHIQGSFSARLMIVWACFAVGAIPKGLSSASRTWESQERRREMQEQLRQMEEKSSARARENGTDLATLRTLARENPAAFRAKVEEIQERAREAKARYEAAKQKSDETAARLAAGKGRWRM